MHNYINKLFWAVVREYIQPKKSLQIIQKLSFTNYRNAAVQYLFVFMDSE